jgi:hypothetical protein
MSRLVTCCGQARNAFLLVMIFALIPARGVAEMKSIQRPLAEEGPTRVYVAMGLLDVDEIDSANQNFTANLFMEINWKDPRLKHSLSGMVLEDLEDIWHPQLLFVNQQKIWSTFPETARISADGTVEYRQRIWGPFSQPLEVFDFPFDTQDFEIRLASANYLQDEIVFEQNPEVSSGLAEKFSLPDWEILGWELNFDPYLPTGSKGGVASFALIFEAERYVSHYVLKIILPLMMIVSMSWIVFWVNPQQAGTQIGVATTSMLTLIAYRFMVGSMMPPVPYLTRMDYFILGSTILVFAALAQAVMTSKMTDRGNLKAALVVDRICRVLFPVLFVVIIAVSFSMKYVKG